MENKTNDLAGFYFHQGTNFYSYLYLGCHVKETFGVYSYTFRVWAPNARAVSLIGDFCEWSTPLPMHKITERGVYEITFDTDASLEGTTYKFQIITGDGRVLLKGDPYAFRSKGKDDGGSVITHPSRFRFTDEAWLAHRKKTIFSADGAYLASPLNIYEVHAASFMRKTGGGYLSYRELADVLIPYVKYMGYTHIEFLPLSEYPFDGSWGYQVGAFYAPTSRFGDPDDLKYLIDTAHNAGVGVLFDWVPAHFPKDEWGLYEFDGVPLYEYQGVDRMESSSWGTRFFDLGREEIQSFLISNALYFLREFHIDGLRVDAVASMLYLDYDRRPGEWLPNRHGGRENLEAIAFLKKLNGTLLSEFPDALMIAEESTAFPGVTHPTDSGGLGFSLKWNMGFANDLYAYLSRDPIYRQYHHKALNFPLMYAFGENYILPISHDEVVHGKRSFIDKMYGSYGDKFSEARAALLLLMTYPGKKMLFMGTEFAQFREWDYENGLEWFMLDYPMHKEFRSYVASLNRFYLGERALWELDFDSHGFEWIMADNSAQNLVAFYRYDLDGNRVIVVISFSGARETVRIPIKKGTVPVVLFETHPDSEGRSLSYDRNRGYEAELTLPAFSGIVIRESDAKLKIKFKNKQKNK